MKTEVIINMDNDELRNHESELPKNRKHLIEGMETFNNNFRIVMTGRMGEPLTYVPHLILSYIVSFFPIMGVHIFNDIKKIDTYKTPKSKMEYLNILNLQYQDHLGGIINFRPEELIKSVGEDGWNYFRTHKCSYNQQTDDLDFEGKNVKGVSYRDTHQFLPKKFYNMSFSKLKTYFLKG